MTDLAQTTARSLLQLSTPAWLRRWWRGILVAACVLLATAYSLVRLAAFSFNESPIGLLVVVPFIAAILFVRLGSRPINPDASKRDLFSDVVFSLPVFLVALFLLLVLPTQQSWYYWLSRLDLLAVPVMAAGCIIVFWGMPNLARTWPALLYLVFVWPVPVLVLQQRLAPVLNQLTTTAVSQVARLAGFPLTPVGDRRGFIVTLADGTTAALPVVDLAAAFAVVAGALLLAIPLTLLLRGSWTRRGIWLGLVVTIAFAANLVRALLLVAAASRLDYRLALDVVYPAVSIAVLGLAASLALVLLRPLGLRFAATTANARLPWQHDKVTLPLGMVVSILVFSLFLGVLNVDLLRFGNLSQQSLPTIRASAPAAVAPELPGWQLESGGPIDWRSIFGINSRAELFQYTSPNGSTVGMQVVLSDDRRLLDSYPLENARLFHLDEVVAVRDVDLGHGLVGRLVETLPDDEAPVSVLYFLVPVVVGDAPYNARIALFFDSSDVPLDGKFPADPLSFATELQTGLNSSLGRYGNSNSDPRFAEMGRFAVGIGRQIVNQLVALRA